MLQHKLSLLLSREEIAQAVHRLGAEIRQDYSGKDPLLVGVLRGSFIFLADLVREINIPLSVDFVRVQSYRSTASTGSPKVSARTTIPVRGKHILLVEDIVDTSVTVAQVMGQLERRGAASLKLCALLDKPSRRLQAVPIDYLGFTVPDRFVVGYGLDVDQQYRYLPDIYVLDEE